jgi:REP element-mobilizing transposase RayT
MGFMTAPRQVLPGTTYLVTRRCAQRQFFLKPSRIGREVFLYVLAVAAQRYGIKVHAYCVLSNHYHLVVTDPLAQLPGFQLYLDGIVARAVNALLGRDEALWGPNSFSAVTLVAPRDVVDKAAYTLANPVAAGLVRAARRWPGLWSSPEAVGAGGVQVRRPNHFFDPEGGLPEAVAFQLSTPPGFPSAEAFREQLTTALAEREAEAKKTASGFLGVARVMAQRATARPRSPEPRRQLNPRVAAKDKWKRIEALGRLVSFLTSYRSALRAWREGRDGVLFPVGTYLMRVMHGAACAGAG